MKCPYCGSQNIKVLDSRDSKDQLSIKRRRECLDCHKRFSTIEKILKLDLEVLKANEQIEEFNVGKIKRSLLKACDKRPITLEQIDNLLNKILFDIKEIKEDPLKTSSIGEIVQKNLKDLDEMAFVKYAIVHNKYGSIKEFRKELIKLNKI